MKMTENFEILSSFIKDMSSETPDVQTFLATREKISGYQLNIDINSKALKDGIIEVNIILKFADKPDVSKKSYFEIIYTSVVRVNNKVSDKKEMEKIILCDVPNKIYPTIEKIFVNLLTDSGFPGIKFEKKVDFTELYNQKQS